jgi:hypothetical protein
MDASSKSKSRNGIFYNRVKLDYKNNITLGRSKVAVVRGFTPLRKIFFQYGKSI